MNSILTINGGSSSIKFALYQADEHPLRMLHGKIDRVGQRGAVLAFTASAGSREESLPVAAPDHGSAAKVLVEWLAERKEFGSVVAVGHRIVHGMEHVRPEIVSRALMARLRRIGPYDPDHLPGEIELMESFLRSHPKLPQVACFDTAFHHTLPHVARQLPIPRRYEAKGIRRYGFHGLSYSYLMEELAVVAGAKAARGRVILAHLGSGASLAAVRNGKSIDTSMGFTPTAGLPMGTRTGDLDPGVAAYLARAERFTAKRFYDMANHESGLLGVSGTSSDMRDLLVEEANDPRAAEAVSLFCYHAKRWVGAFAAILGGLDTLVFAAGIGENCPSVRARICDGLDFLGIKLDTRRNAKNAAVISTGKGPVAVRVITTDEEKMIARSVYRLLKQ